MSEALLIQLATILSPIIAAALTGGGIVAYFNYRATRPESDAKAKQINVTAEINVADAWQNYAVKVEARFTALEKKYDEAIELKNKEIDSLTKEVNRLRTALSKYESEDAKMGREAEAQTIKDSAEKLAHPENIIPPKP